MVYLLSSERLKADFANENLADEYIKSASITAHNYLRETIGDNLYEAIEDRVDNNTLTGTPYEALLNDFIIPYLEFTVMGEMCVLTSFKTGNIGVFSNYDQNANQNELATVKYVEQYWSQRGEFYRNRMLKFLNKNKADFPEWKCGCTNEITSASQNNVVRTGIWLGGK